MSELKSPLQVIGPALQDATRPCIALVSSNPQMPAWLTKAFHALSPGADLRYGDDLGNLADVEVAACWRPPPGMLAKFNNLRLIQSSGAGVDHILCDPTIPAEIPICRIVDDSMAKGMTGYIVWAVLSHHRNMPLYSSNAARGIWYEYPIEPAHRHVVGILGTGRLGSECAAALSDLGCPVLGWHRGPRDFLISSGFCRE